MQKLHAGELLRDQLDQVLEGPSRQAQEQVKRGYRVYTGIMEKKMETTTIVMDNQMEKKMENEMEARLFYGGDRGLILQDPHISHILSA